jgi:hypothetical protein
MVCPCFIEFLGASSAFRGKSNFIAVYAQERPILLKNSLFFIFGHLEYKLVEHLLGYKQYIRRKK